VAQCLVCSDREATLSENLCEECADSLAARTPLVPEQIISSNTAITGAALLDQWGRPHYVDDVVQLGRQFGREGIAILDSSVSREHAVLSRVNGAWVVRDNSSTNGTSLGDVLVEGEKPVSSGDQLTLGSVGFYFVTPTDKVTKPDHELAGETVKPQASQSAVKIPAAAPSNDEDSDEPTFSGLPKVPVLLVEPTGGGGGFIKALGKTVQLTTTQFEFVALVARRMADEPHQPDLVRGFVRSSELLADISWDTAHPSDNHVKQLVRRVRRALVRGGIGNLIESRHRFGYRFRIIPIFDE